jgi:AcrR family transcriptional regulator
MPMKNKENRFAKIIEVATDLFYRKNFPRTSMQEIAEGVGIYKGSLYYYVSSKEDLLFHIIYNAVTESVAQLTKVQKEICGSSEILRRAIFHHVQYTAEHKAELGILLEDAKHLTEEYQQRIKNELERYEKIFERIIKQGIRSGEFKDVNPRVVCFGILGMCNWVYRWFSREGDMAPEQIASLFADMILSGLRKTNHLQHPDANRGLRKKH